MNERFVCCQCDPDYPCILHVHFGASTPQLPDQCPYKLPKTAETVAWMRTDTLETD